MSDDHEQRIKHLESSSALFERGISEIRDAIVGGVDGKIGMREMLRQALEDLHGPAGDPREGLTRRVKMLESERTWMRGVLWLAGIIFSFLGFCLSTYAVWKSSR